MPSLAMKPQGLLQYGFVLIAFATGCKTGVKFG